MSYHLILVTGLSFFVQIPILNSHRPYARSIKHFFCRASLLVQVSFLDNVKSGKGGIATPLSMHPSRNEPTTVVDVLSYVHMQKPKVSSHVAVCVQPATVVSFSA